ncbi:MAG: zinc-binding dehydrogenase [Burkholderiaceae bacterium]
MLRINPATALLLLTDLRQLEPGDWVIQNVGNSGVGRWVMLLAQQMGLRTVNVVRRQSLFAEMYSLGADVCVVDGPELAARVRAETGQQPIGLALDAVGGQATSRLASCVADGGLVCHYGTMSGEDPLVPRSTSRIAGCTSPVSCSGASCRGARWTRSPKPTRGLPG